MRVVNYRGIDLGSLEAFNVGIPVSEDYSFESSVQLTERIGQGNLYEAVVPQRRTLPLYIKPGATASGNADLWRQHALALFNPYLGPGIIQVEHNGITMETLGVITRIKQHAGIQMRVEEPGFLDATIELIDPVWREVTPITVVFTGYTPGGNHPVEPKIIISRAANALRTRVLVTDRTGRGLKDYLIKIGGGDSTAGTTLNTSGVSANAATNYIFFHGNKPVPFLILNPGNATTTVAFVQISCGPFETTYVDIVFGAGIANTATAQKLDPAGRRLDDVNFSNAVWVWRSSPGIIGDVYAPSVWELARQPRIPGVWYNETLNFHNAGEIFNIEENPSNNVKIGWVQGNGTVLNDAMILQTQVKTKASSPALRGLNLQLNLTSEQLGALYNPIVIFVPPPSGTPNGYENGLVQYLPAGGTKYLAGTASPASGTDITDVNVPGAVAVAITTKYNRLLTIQEQASTSPFRLELDTSEYPTVTIQAPVSSVQMNKVITNTTLGQSVTVDNIFYDAADLEIDTHTRQITPSSFLRLSPAAGIRFSERYGKFQFQDRIPNNWSVSGDASASVIFHSKNAYVI